jgi:hypothetical protein
LIDEKNRLSPLPARDRARPEVGVAIVGYVSLERLSAEIAGVPLPGFSIEDEPFDSAVGDEAIIIHIHTTRGSVARATRLMLALFGALTPDVIALRDEGSVGHAQPGVVVSLRSIPGDAD